MNGLVRFGLIVTAGVLLAAARSAGEPPPPAKDVIVEGLVHTQAGKGVPSLTVQLIPPKSSKNPRLILKTDRGGNFRFQDRDPQKYMGKHLLEVYDGPKLIFRKEIDTSRDEFRRVSIPVK
jgi:hypothetical protein